MSVDVDVDANVNVDVGAGVVGMAVRWCVVVVTRWLAGRWQVARWQVARWQYKKKPGLRRAGWLLGQVYVVAFNGQDRAEFRPFLSPEFPI